MEADKNDQLWKLAKKRVGFKRHLTTYLIINFLLWLLWYFTDHNTENAGIPWPIFTTFGWGAGLFFHFINVYVLNKHRAIEKEYEKLKRNNER